MTASVMVAIRVAATPSEAFSIFVEEIGEWWRPNALFDLTPRGDGVLRFENGEGGRLVALLTDGKEFEVGRITEWAPGERLCFTWRPASFAPDQSTTVEILFDAVGDETRVSVTHRGWDGVPQTHVARHGFPLGAFQQRLAERWRDLLASLASSARGN